MEWTEGLQKAVGYIEAHLMENISVTDAAKAIYISPFYFQKGFKVMTGYSVAEYIRNRRLYLAALDAISGSKKVIDLAYQYGYDTPESFTKAFTRFHGISPVQIRSHAEKIKTFLPLKIVVSIQGGNDMDYAVERVKEFQVIGFEKKFSFDFAYHEIPGAWEEYRRKYCVQDSSQGEIQQAVCDCHIGEFGICIDDLKEEGFFRYLIAGTYHGGTVPEGMTLYSLPEMEWAKFRCTGPMPGALQAVNTKIWGEWLPANPDYEIAAGVNIERYAMGNIEAADYESEIWIPVKRKNDEI